MRAVFGDDPPRPDDVPPDDDLPRVVQHDRPLHEQASRRRAVDSGLRHADGHRSLRFTDPVHAGGPLPRLGEGACALQSRCGRGARRRVPDGECHRRRHPSSGRDVSPDADLVARLRDRHGARLAQVLPVHPGVRDARLGGRGDLLGGCDNKFITDYMLGLVSTEQLGKDMLSSANFAEYLEAYKIDADAKIKALEKQGETYSTREKLTMHKPLLMLSTIQNSTDEHIDTRLLTERLREVLFNSGKVRFTTYAAGQGQNIDTATADARNLKFDPNVKKSTVAQKNRVNAFDLTLAGSIIKQTAQDGRSNEISYTFSLTLTDTTTGEGVWTKNLEIKRQHKQGGFGW